MSSTPAGTPFPLAMPAPPGPVTVFSTEQVAEAVALSRQSPRGRIVRPYHPTAGDSLHRMLNALQPHTYVQPHRHSAPPKAETLVVLQGAIGCAIFNETGTVEAMHVLGPNRRTFGIDIHAGVFHTFVALEPDTVVFEVKNGPYEKVSDKDFAPWAPREGAPGAPEYLAQLVRLCANPTAGGSSFAP